MYLSEVIMIIFL